MKVLFLTQTGQGGASARYRVYQFLNYLKQKDIESSIVPAVSDYFLERYYKSRSLFTKFEFYSSQVLKRLQDIPKTRKFDIVFIQRDLIIHIYPFIEKLISLFNRRIIFDFDDAIYLYPPSKNPGFFFNLLWDRKKIERIIKLSKHVIVANGFLKKYAENFSKNVTVIPTSIDLGLYGPNNRLKDTNGKITIGWIGSQGTFGYLEKIFPVFIELAARYEIELKVIGANGPRIDGVDTCYRDWNINTEIEDIYSFDIGIMPLTDDEWSRGKSGTKLLQYMAAGVPAVASPVGANTEIIKDGINGFLAADEEQWKEKIIALIEEKELSNQMAKRARADVEKFYSIQANAPKLINVLEEAL